MTQMPTPSSRGAQPLRLLLVEDERTQARRVQAMVARLGVDITMVVATSLAEARGMQDGRFDAVLLDLTLPDSEGEDTLRAMRRAMPDVPLVVLTADDDPELALSLLSQGAQDFLVKGEVDGKTLLRSLRYAVERLGSKRRQEEQAARLQASQQRFRDLFEVSPVPHYEFDITRSTQRLQQDTAVAGALGGDGELPAETVHAFVDAMLLIAANPAALALSGANSLEDFGSVADLVAPESLGALGKVVAALLRGETPEAEEIVGLALNGQRFHLRLSFATLSDEQGHASRLLATAVDLTEIRSARIELERSELRFRELIDHLRTGILILEARDGGDRFVCSGANPLVESLAGSSGQSVLGQSVEKVLPLTCMPDVMQALREVWRSGRPCHFGDVSCRHQGEQVWQDVYIYRLLSGEVILALADVTERKRIELQTRLHAIALESTSYAVVITDVNGTVQWVNPAFTELTGYASEDVMGGNPRVLKSGTHPASFYHEMWQRLAAGQVWSGELVNRRKDGSLYSEHMTITPVRAERGAITHFIAVKFDISARKALEAQLMQAQKLESIGQLAAGVAHEINTPIQFIGDNLRFLAEASTQLFQAVEALLKAAAAEAGQLTDVAELDYLREEIPRATAESLDGVEHVAEIVRAMKAFSHPGTQDSSMSDLNGIVGNAATISRNEWKYACALELDLDPDLPLVPCHPGELGQVMLNLIVNAAHAIVEDRGPQPAAKGTIRIRTRAHGDAVRIEVQDDGPGIPAEHREKVFDPFFTTKEVGRGSGQGLAIAYTVITELHRGSIRLESALGEGTTFFIDLPMEAPANATAVPSGEREPQPSS